jgi:hypothetical protein
MLKYTTKIFVKDWKEIDIWLNSHIETKSGAVFTPVIVGYVSTAAGIIITILDNQ